MKKTILLLLIAALFAACSDDDDKDELRKDPNFNPVIGEWVGGGTKYGEKYIFYASFTYVKYTAPNAIDWETDSSGEYLINSNQIKIGGELMDYFVHDNQLGLKGVNEDTYYIYYKP